MTKFIALCEDNGVNQNTFFQKIKLLEDVQVVFVASNGHECLEQLKGLPSAKIPQIIFMDIEMPELNGIETIRLAKSIHSEIHFIVLTVFDDDEKIFEAIKAGASGYLLKHEPAQVLKEAIMNVLEFGGAPMSPAIARKTLLLMSKATFTKEDQKGNIPEIITNREEEILKFMVNGWDAKRIAEKLNISVLTVRKHIANLYDKLHVQSKAEVISMAYQQKWFNN